MHLIDRLSRRALTLAPELKERFPLLEPRANRYLHLLVRLATIVIYGLAALAVMQAWDIAAFAWFRTEFGRRATGVLLSIAVVLAISLAVWEIFSAAIERNLTGLEQAGAPSRTRRRTLLPLLRTTMLGVIIVVAGLTVLSQLGINIAPLLAGAGVIGLAVGFGSQALVKDVITGLFILIEDQIAVGDIVDLGKEHAGVVETISIRTIRLRDLSGIVHTVPFSEVTSVKNLTKDFSFVVARVAIAYRENIDEVVEILRGVCDELAERRGTRAVYPRPLRLSRGGQSQRALARADVPRADAAGQAMGRRPRPQPPHQDGVRRARDRDPRPLAGQDRRADPRRARRSGTRRGGGGSDGRSLGAAAPNCLSARAAAVPG